MKLSKGMEVKDTEGRIYIVKDQIGEGAQGAVYDTEKGDFLLKVLRVNEERRQEIVDRFKWIMRQKISNESRIVTPIAILQEPHIGYVMKKAKGHKSLNKYLSPPTDSSLSAWYNIDTGGLRKRIEIAVSLSKCYRQLHLQGLCYCDVSPNNILVASSQRSIVLIDSDNLTSTGLFSTSILGTPRYIAPELFTLNKQPNSITDTYSFAVILFEILRLGHPLVGDEILYGTPEEEEEAVRGNAVYIDHPDDDSNRNSSILPADIILTKELRDLFQKMFVDGLHNYMKRPTLYEFTTALQTAEDLLVQCDNHECMAHFYYQEGQEQICPWCDEKKHQHCTVKIVETSNITDDLFKEGKIKISRELAQIILNQDARAIYRRHLESYVSQDSDKMVAIVKRVDENHFIIKNSSSYNFLVINRQKQNRSILKPDESRNLHLRDDLVVFDAKQNVEGISDVFEQNNMLKSLIFKFN